MRSHFIERKGEEEFFFFPSPLGNDLIANIKTGKISPVPGVRIFD